MTQKTFHFPKLATCVGVCLALFVSYASAAEVRIKDREGQVHEPTMIGSADVLEFEAALGEGVLEMILDEKPTRIERQRFYQLALSDEGAWSDVPDAEVPGASSQLPAALKWSERNDLPHEAKIDFRWRQAWTDSVDKTLGEKWSQLARNCAKGVGSEGSSCYIYESRREIKVWFAGSARPVLIRLLFPGGC